ncbi:MAG: hypothetical protein L6V88_05195 [Anaerotruncus sp.]|nr:MAG: hypothetical protein L6V88_05195 [Anaerotruncus sp.]
MKITFLFARAERFTEETNIDDIWNLNLNVAFRLFERRKKYSFFIDALEFIADAKTNKKIDLLHTLFEIVKKIILMLK